MLKNKILILRKERSWTLEELAEKTGISKQHLNRLETYHHNARLNESNITQLCKAFDISVGELFGERVKKMEDSISQSDMALTQIIQALLKILLDKKYVLPAEVEGVLGEASDLYRAHRLTNAERIANELRSTLTVEARKSEQEVIHKLLSLAPLGMA